MKKNLTILTAVLVVAAVAFLNVRMVLSEKGSSLSLFNIETAQADDPYEQGPAGSNWQTYTTNCTKSTMNCYTVSAAPGGVGGSVQHCTTTTYTASMSVCGYGGGFCLSSAGC